MLGGLGISDVFLILLIITCWGLWVYAVTDIMQHQFTGSGRTFWIIVVIFMPVIGTILYFAIGQKERIIKE